MVKTAQTISMFLISLGVLTANGGGKEAVVPSLIIGVLATWALTYVFSR